MKKRFTLMLVAMLVAMTSFAQPVLKSATHRRTLAMPTLQAKTAARRAAAPRKAEAVTPPTGAVEQDYVLSGYYYAGSWTIPEVAAKVVIDGSDVYIQGLSQKVEGAWIKGTLDGTTLTIENGQYYGKFDSPDQGEVEMYWVTYDFNAITSSTTLTYDPETGVFTHSDDDLILENSNGADELGFYGGWNDFTLTPGILEIPEFVVVPDGLETADYTFKGISMGISDDGTEFVEEGSQGFNAKIGLDGADIYIEGLNPTSTDPVYVKGTSNADGSYTFASGQYVGDYSGTHLYVMGYNPETDEFTDIVLTYDAEADTYTVADGTWIVLNASKTEIFSFYIMKDGVFTPGAIQTESIKWVAAEQGYSTTSEVIESIDFGAGISATLDKGTSTTQPTYYENGQALRFYAGNTMTITSDGPNIVKIIFEMGNTTTNITADTGELTVDGTTVTWEGSATEVTFNGPSAKHARIVSMEIFYEAGEEPAPELVTLPDGAEPVEYLFTETYTTQDEETGEDVEEEYTKHAFVAVVGDQVYFQGLSDYVPEGWVVGTLEEGVITIPTGEYLGVFSRSIEGMGYVDFDVFSNEIHFTYDAEADKYNAGALSFAVNYSGSTITNEEYGSVELTRIVEKDALPQAPEVVAVDLTGEYPYIVLNVPTQDVNGDEMLTSKLSYQIVIEDQSGSVYTYTFTSDQYASIPEGEDMESVPYLYNDGYDIYTGGNPVYVYAEDFTQWAAIRVRSYYSSGMSETTRYDLTEYWTGIDDVAAATDGAVKAVKYYDLQGRPATGATRGIVVAVKTMADGSTKTQKVLRK